MINLRGDQLIVLSLLGREVKVPYVLHASSSRRVIPLQSKKRGGRNITWRKRKKELRTVAVPQRTVRSRERKWAVAKMPRRCHLPG